MTLKKQQQGTVTTEELLMAVRRQSAAFSRGSSAFRGVTAHPSGRWEARVGAFGFQGRKSWGQEGGG
jgi:hypothetical protein